MTDQPAKGSSGKWNPLLYNPSIPFTQDISQTSNVNPSTLSPPGADRFGGFRDSWAPASQDHVGELNLTPRPDKVWGIPDSIRQGPFNHVREEEEEWANATQEPKIRKGHQTRFYVPPGESEPGDDSTRTREFSSSSFVEDYYREYNFWDILAEATKAICEEEVKNKRRIKCHVTCRAKSESSVREKVERKEKERGSKFSSREDIDETLIDLAGVRITLAFPKDVQEIKNFLEHYFGEVEQRFWGLDKDGKVTEGRSKERFIGYRATHFLVKWSQPRGGVPGHKLQPKHNGKTIEIQVTSIIMNAWQEAQHDLIYKQLNGVPSEDERNLLDMINGLAHAGEVALTQLQICLQRRIEDNTREFADEYQVRAWLIKHVPDILHFKWNGQGPYMRRLSTLFNILRNFNLKKPLELEDKLRDRTWHVIDLGIARSDFLGQVLPWILGPLNEDEDIERWKKAFRSDATDWAIMRLCSEPCMTFSDNYPSHYRHQPHWDRHKAFILTNTINLALADGFVRQGWIQDLLTEVLSLHPERKATLVNSWFTILNSSYDDQTEDNRMDSGHMDNVAMNDDAMNDAPQNHSANMSQLWDTFLKVARDWDSMSLRINLAISLSGIVVIPATGHAEFVNQSKPRFAVWHGPSPSNIDGCQWRDTVTILPSGEQLPLNKFEWKMERIDLENIADGEGWFPDGLRPEIDQSVGPITPKLLGNLAVRKRKIP
ncbi:hypothetical protein CC80DRAFT_207686 [Byssothecium circinans]|uniref:RelA/SpoT domain-containing protein n=1 Tax=Byssothecium circinans TaxID=147558 RepID=A0A6A5TFV7_9PLEO|nr:hypothetical protein CC80DRAFT_207686 [Byssothecium circinans]